MKKFICTTAIDYANSAPHIGHAYEKLAADALCRYHTQRGEESILVLGSDEHGQKVARSAVRAEETPQDYVDKVSANFQKLWHDLNIGPHRFVRTSSQEHQRSVTAFLDRIEQVTPDAFYEHKFTALYCVGCEAYVDQSVTSCAVHPTLPLEEVTELNWFFKLSLFQERLKEQLANNPSWLLPSTRRAEIWSLLKDPLSDVSISRSATRVPWGFPFKATSDGTPQTLYVWLDALPSYLTALGFPDREDLWPATLQIIGKDITRFHALLWPALLLAAELPLPKKLWAHGFVEIGGQRASNSAPTSFDLRALLNSVGPDAFRFLLLKEVPFDADGSLTPERLAATYISELAHGLGNLANRILTLLRTKCSGLVPTDSLNLPESHLHLQARQEFLEDYHQAMSTCLLHKGLASLQGLTTATNKYLQTTKPWSADPVSQAEILHQATLSLLSLAAAYHPFLPKATEQLWLALGGTGVPSWPIPDPSGWAVQGLAPLFPEVVIKGFTASPSTTPSSTVVAKSPRLK